MADGRAALGRFAVVGVVNTAIDFVLFGLLALAGWPLLLANFVSTSAGMTFSFFVNRSWTFGSTRSIRSTVLPFLLVTAVGLWVIQPLVIVAVGGLLDAAAPSLPEQLRQVWVPKAVAIGVGLVWNFSWYHRSVFRAADEDVSDVSREERIP
ncbi:GtrA family protein [Nocardioides KLBMP 9356]|uniref:GtrA family protein n=1 Tax=Nocardioides potassii TaxID=2911371 RepID=A0ABS9HEQ8_9ACTN|nr:GtrA family protein [Nocardioides potassii]MCF6378548.1 GtrA family protein [Nocardioides potassii]